jgi:hypothetical protein
MAFWQNAGYIPNSRCTLSECVWHSYRRRDLGRDNSCSVIDPEQSLYCSLDQRVCCSMSSRIVMRSRRGFTWRGKLIRPEEVIAKRFK